jgi:hypothetical protein
MQVPPASTDPRIKYVKSSSQKIRNIEVAVTQHCNVKGYAVLLHKEETFIHKEVLKEIAKEVQSREIVGAFISLRIGDNTITPGDDVLYFHRGQQAIVEP